ncbi:Sulfite exporter TauE/SafE [Seminavis robusta]|uniref:Sulfite exporter TauE/SafE n=1 Tax=Seminavis robusta TaxID=568900 RepID=A0A9N8H6I0_9STRA|nr:Sulfite exporter TauE/SafE [Seminavis robusta]|eukprot:Sro112_g055780.1 Sulfite exporter TauE/SafE (368) ;mRNA; f:79496-80599
MNTKLLLEQENGDPMAAYVSQAWSLEGQLPLLIAIAALLGLGKGGVPGFATVATAATVATSPTSIPGGLGLAVALQVPILTMIDVSASWLHYKDLDFDTIKLLLPMSFVGMGLGVWLDKQLTDANARLLVGLLLLMILAVQMGKDTIMGLFDDDKDQGKQQQPKHAKEDSSERIQDDNEQDMIETGKASLSQKSLSDNKSPLRRRPHSHDSHDVPSVGLHSTTSDHHKKPTAVPTHTVVVDPTTKLIWACVVGIVGGAATMLTNAMGPILNVYLLSVVRLPPTAYIGTRAMFFCFLNCGKLPMRFLSGTLGWSMMPLAGFLGVISVLGVMGAKPIMLSMSETNFVRLELAVVAFSGVRLCWMGLYGG